MDKIIISWVTDHNYFRDTWLDTIRCTRLGTTNKLTFDDNLFESETMFDIIIEKDHDIIKSITLVTTLKESNEWDLKFSKVTRIDNELKKRKIEINALNEDRLSLIEKCDSIDPEHEETEINSMCQDIGLISEQIRKHYHEIKLIQHDSEFEIEEVIKTYTLTLERDKILYVNGLPGQRRSFFLWWGYNTHTITEPINVTRNKRRINVSYSELKTQYPSYIPNIIYDSHP